MTSSLTRAALLAVAIAAASLPLSAQLQDNTQPQLACENSYYSDSSARHCEMREQTLPSIGRLSVDASPNGAANIKGWLRSDVLVRSRIETRGDTEAAAAATSSQVSITASGGEIRALGPQTQENSSWSVSYEIFVPQTTDLDFKSHNGALSISDVRGQLHFELNNGAVRLKRVAGDVSGTTSNGAIQADLTGSIWEGRQLELTTHNGAVTVTVPSNYSAHVRAETGNGGIQSDFPMNLTGNLKPRVVDFDLNSSGPLIHITTGNGSIRLKRADATQ
jgi:hypothetical protein